MMRRAGHADLPLHGGRVPAWLAERMSLLGSAIIESIVADFGRSEVLSRLSDPLWFQSLGCVMGMDWHSSGITTSVMGALKRGLQSRSTELGLHICGGRGRHSRNTPAELTRLADRTGMDGEHLVRSSRLCAKVDNTAVQDGFQIYLHSFIVSEDGEWAVVQQGMNADVGQARRYHWHSPGVESFVNEPHSSVCGEHLGQILNLTHPTAETTRDTIVGLSSMAPDQFVREARHIVMPGHHDVRAKDVNLTRLASMIELAHGSGIDGFENLLLLKGMGPRTIQSLALVSEVIYGTPTRFDDPARFSMAHGGKDGHPFPVPLSVYDETIEFLNSALTRSKLQQSDKKQAFAQLHKIAAQMEAQVTPDPKKYDQWITKEKQWSSRYGGRTVFDDKKESTNNQLRLF